MTLRPTLHLVRQELTKGVENIGETIVMVLVAHLNDKLAGELETFIEGAMGRLGGLLDDCAKFADQVIDKFAAGFFHRLGHAQRRVRHRG